MKKAFTSQEKFWVKRRGKIDINYYNFIVFLQYLNICRIEVNGYSLVVRVEGKTIQLLSTESLSKLVLHTVLKELPDAVEYKERMDAANVLVEKSQKLYHHSTLNHLPVHDITLLQDSRDHCRLPFKNKVLNISKDSVEEISYDDLNYHVFKSSIIKRNFHVSDHKGDFAWFVWRCSGRKYKRYMALVCALGYLVHKYKDPTNAKIVILVDEIADEHNIADGGRGKSLILKMLTYVGNCIEIAGKTFQSSSRFAYQRVSHETDNIVINDVTKHESLDNFFNVSTDDFIIERKFEKEKVIPFKDSPKIAITANNLIKQTDGYSSERRKHEIEISGYYGRHLNPKQELGRALFDEWGTEEWNRLYNFVVWAVQCYLTFGLVEPPKINIYQRKLLNVVGPELTEYLDDIIKSGETKIHKKDTYDEYIKGGFINRRYQPNRGTFTRKIKKYFEYRSLSYREMPSDTKLYFEIITDKTIEKQTEKSLKDFTTDYKVVDTKTKLKKMDKKINQ